MALPADPRVLTMLQERHLNKKGVLAYPLNLDNFRKKAAKAYPDIASDLPKMLEKLEPTINARVCRKYPIDKQGRFSDRTMVVEGLRKLRPDLSKVALEKVVIAIEDGNVTAKQPTADTPQMTAHPAPTHPADVPVFAKLIPLAVWIKSQYLEQGFTKLGFIGWKKFTTQLLQARPSHEVEIRELIPRLRVPGSSHELPDPSVITNTRAEERRKAQKNSSANASMTLTTQVATPPTSSQDPPSMLQTKTSPELQHTKNTAVPSQASASRWLANDANVAKPPANSASVADQGRIDASKTPLDPIAPLQATEFASSGFSSDFSTPFQARSQATTLRTHKTSNHRLSGSAGSSHSSSDDFDPRNDESSPSEDDFDAEGLDTEELSQAQGSDLEFYATADIERRGTRTELDDLVWQEYRSMCCNEQGIPSTPLNFIGFRQKLLTEHPCFETELVSALKK